MECEGAQLRFQNIKCASENNGKLILKELSGNFPLGALIAIVGPSGSGKTALLNILSAYKSGNATYDSLQLNGVNTSVKHLATISCYLAQDIHLNNSLTVEENMRFAFDFTLGEDRSHREKDLLISDVLDSFGLSSARDVRTKRLSGGERKRLALALAMASDPSILFLDEPTSGLDVFTTRRILEYLKKIAGGGKTVICTIHQLSASHLELFDWVYAIGNGERAYQGRPQTLVPFLKDVGLPCEIYHSPTDYLIELCCGDYGEEKMIQLLKASKHTCKVNLMHITPQSENQIDQIIAVSWSYQFQTLLQREYLKLRRNYLLIYGRFLLSCIVGVLIGEMFRDVESYERKALLFYNFILGIHANHALSGILTQMVVFPLEMDVVKREVHNKHYTVGQYYLSVTILDFPISVLSIVASSMIMYCLTGQAMEQDRVMLFLLFMVLYGLIVNAFGFCAGTSLNLRNAVFVAYTANIILMVMSGFGILPQDLPTPIEVFSRASFHRQSVRGTLIALLGLRSRNLGCGEEMFCQHLTGFSFLKEFLIDPHDYGTSLYVLMGWYVVIRAVTYYTMRHRLCTST